MSIERTLDEQRSIDNKTNTNIQTKEHDTSGNNTNKLDYIDLNDNPSHKKVNVYAVIIRYKY